MKVAIAGRVQLCDQIPRQRNDGYVWWRSQRVSTVQSRKMTIPLFHVDAFTDRPFAGNPAAVCLLPTWKDERWLQAVAREKNLSD